jgi:hypothetical protein
VMFAEKPLPYGPQAQDFVRRTQDLKLQHVV